jgi:hypothetical protein
MLFGRSSSCQATVMAATGSIVLAALHWLRTAVSEAVDAAPALDPPLAIVGRFDGATEELVVLVQLKMHATVSARAKTRTEPDIT